MVQVQTEEAGRTQYVPAGPQITILKRPDQAARARRSDQERNRQPTKTLKQVTRVFIFSVAVPPEKFARELGKVRTSGRDNNRVPASGLLLSHAVMLGN